MQYDTILIGIGCEWRSEHNLNLTAVYEKLYSGVRYKNFFIVTTVTDAKIYESSFGKSDGFFAPAKQIVAPCGNQNWRQCERSCTKDIWEAGEVADGICPHCGAMLIANTIEAPNYIEEGYLPQWSRYLQWLSNTVGRPMLILELGVDLSYPTVIRIPFEKTAALNARAELIRVNAGFPQLPEELLGRAVGIRANSVDFVRFMQG